MKISKTYEKSLAPPSVRPKSDYSVVGEESQYKSIGHRLGARYVEPANAVRKVEFKLGLINGSTAARIPPQGLKPAFLAGAAGTAEAVPSQKTFMRPVLKYT
jgi:hypothetical protein